MSGLTRALLGPVVATAVTIAACGPKHVDPGAPFTPARPPTKPPPPIEVAPSHILDPTRPAIEAGTVERLGDQQWLQVVPAHMRPGRHTLTLDMAYSRAVSAAKGFDWACGVSWPGLGPEAVGWGQIETATSDACAAFVLQLAVLFDTTLLDQVPVKLIEQAILTYDDEEFPDCGILAHLGSPTGGVACWTDGDGAYEHKPDGCVDVRVPDGDWRTGPIPRWRNLLGTAPVETGFVKRRSAREWDVTVPFNYQAGPTLPLGFTRRYGFLLSGWPWTLDPLTAQDNTVCVSRVTNIQLHVTYSVPPPGPGPRPPD